MQLHYVGVWRSLVARYLGVVEVVSSNLATPTMDIRILHYLTTQITKILFDLFHCF